MPDDLHLHPLHARLVELETAFAFQQKQVEDLHTGLLAQSRSLQQLEKQVRSLQEMLNARQSASEYKSKAATEQDAEEDMSE
jgi:uncharacterized coiled-coil protein SlyX